jgi:hypothetical protein
MMVYCTEAQVKNRAKNFPNSISTTTETTEMIAQTSAMINVELRVAADIATEPYATALRKVCVDVVLMMILEARTFKENNLMDNVTSFWAITPEFTDRQRRLFNSIREQVEDQTFAYSTRTGQEVT